MSFANNYLCLCGDWMGDSLQDVTEHLERKHQLVTSAAVLASNMFVNWQSFQEVGIILKEFDEKNAAIEHVVKSKKAVLGILAGKDQEIKELTEEVFLKFEEIRELQEEIHQKDSDLKEINMEMSVKIIKLKLMSDDVSEKDKVITELCKEVCQKDEDIEKLEDPNNDLEIKELSKKVLLKDQEFQDKSKELLQKDQHFKELNEDLSQKDHKIQELSEKVLLKDQEFQEKSKELLQKDQDFKELNEDLSQKDHKIQELSEFVSQKDQVITELCKKVSKKDDSIQYFSNEVTRKEGEVKKLREKVWIKDQKLKELNEISTLKDQEFKELSAEVTQKDREVHKLCTEMYQEIKDLTESVSKKDEETKILKDLVRQDINMLAKTKADAQTELKYETSRLRQRNENEKAVQRKEMTDQHHEVVDLKVRCTSLTTETETLRRHSSSLVIEVKGKTELAAENIKLRDCVQVQQGKLRSLAERVENVKSRIAVERSALFLKVSCLTSELAQNKEILDGLNKENESIKKHSEALQKSEKFNTDKSVKMSNLLRKMVKEVNMDNMRLRMSLKKREFNHNFPNQEKLQAMFEGKVKENKDMRKVFDVEKLNLEDKLNLKESVIINLTKDMNHALVQANFLNSDIQKHQQNLVKHFQTILTEKEVIRNTHVAAATAGNRTTIKLYDEALNSVVKSLTNTSVGERVLKISSEAVRLRSCLSDGSLSAGPGFTGPLSEHNNNDKVTGEMM